MNPNQALWEKGDFTRIAETMRQSGEALVRSIGVAKGTKVLDLGSGDGTTAIPEAKLGADVLGVDIATNLVAAGNRRARELGLANQYVDAFRRYYGPTMNAFDAAAKSGRADALQGELEALFRSKNESGSAARTTIPATFLRVTVAVE